jgi:hypothetical protein
MSFPLILGTALGTFYMTRDVPKWGLVEVPTSL